MPKAGCNGYSLFAEQMRSSLEEKSGRPLLRINDLLKEAAPYWSKLPEEDKQGWKERARDYKRSDDFALKKREARIAQWDRSNRPPYAKQAFDDHDQWSEHSDNDMADGQDPDVLDEFELPGPVSSAQSKKVKQDFKFTVNAQGEILWNKEMVPTEQGELRESLAPLSHEDNEFKQQRSSWRGRPAAGTSTAASCVSRSAPYNTGTAGSRGCRTYTACAKGDRDYGTATNAYQQEYNGYGNMSVASSGRGAVGHNNKGAGQGQADCSTDRVFKCRNGQAQSTSNTLHNAPTFSRSVSTRGKFQRGNSNVHVDRDTHPPAGAVCAYQVPPRLQRGASRKPASASSRSYNEALLAQVQSSRNPPYNNQHMDNTSQNYDSEFDRQATAIYRDLTSVSKQKGAELDDYECVSQEHSTGFGTAVVFENTRYQQTKNKQQTDTVHAPSGHFYEGSSVGVTGTHLLHSFSTAAAAANPVASGSCSILQTDTSTPAQQLHMAALVTVADVKLSSAAPRVLCLQKVCHVLDVVGPAGNAVLECAQKQTCQSVPYTNHHTHTNARNVLPTLFPNARTP